MAFATPLLIGVSLLSGVVGAIGASQAAKASAEANEYNAKVAEVNAEVSQDQAVADAKKKKRDRIRVMGSLTNRAGANGLALSGVVLDLANDSFLEAEEDIQLTRYSGNVRATDFRNQAAGFRMAARHDRDAGRIGVVSNLLGGVGSALRVGS